jgi:hypothetical protein
LELDQTEAERVSVKRAADGGQLLAKRVGSRFPAVEYETALLPAFALVKLRLVAGTVTRGRADSTDANSCTDKGDVKR